MTSSGALFRSRKTVLCCGLIVTTAILLVLIMPFYEQKQAEKLIATLSSVQPGSTQESSARGLLRKAAFRSVDVSACKHVIAGCEQYQFSNMSLAFLHLVPARWIWVTVYYQNGVVAGKSFQFIESSHSSAIVRETITKETTTGRNVSFRDHRYGIAIARIDDDASVPLTQRQSDWRIDLTCMTKIRACNDPRMVLVGAFPVSH